MVLRVVKLLYIVAVVFTYNFGVQAQDVDIQEIMQLAQAGDANAQQSLAVLYATGDGVELDQAEAVKWYTLAAEQGNAEAQTTLGVHYALGLGVEKDQARAAEFYQLAVDQGIAVAQHTLAVKYALGQGVEEDQVHAAELYQLAADQNLAVAQHTLGVHYALGQGVETDKVRSGALYQLAADQSLAVSQHALAVKYQLGVGFGQDSYEAVYWYRKAAANGLAISQYTLAVHYMLGLGVSQDEHEAIRLYLLAAGQGLKIAQDALRNKDVDSYYAQAIDTDASAGVQDAMAYEPDSVVDGDSSTQTDNAYAEDASVAESTYSTNTEEEAQALIEPMESSEPVAQELSQDVPVVTESPQVERSATPGKAPTIANKPFQLQAEESSWSLWSILGFIGVFLVGIVVYMRWREISAQAEKSEESSGEGKSAIGYW